MRTAMLAAAALTLAASARPAAADTPAETLAHFLVKDVERIKDATAYELVGVRDYTHVVIGRFSEREYLFPTMVLLRCDTRQCFGTRVFLGSAGTLRLLGTVDLDGKAGPLRPASSLPRAYPGWDNKLAWPTKKPRWPALVLEHQADRTVTTASRFGGEVTGTATDHRLLIVSLRKADAARPLVLDLETDQRYPTGVGETTTYTLERGQTKGALDVVASEQHHIDNQSACLEPPPVIYKITLVKGRFERAPEGLRSGCH